MEPPQLQQDQLRSTIAEVSKTHKDIATTSFIFLPPKLMHFFFLAFLPFTFLKTFTIKKIFCLPWFHVFNIWCILAVVVVVFVVLLLLLMLLLLFFLFVCFQDHRWWQYLNLIQQMLRKTRRLSLNATALVYLCPRSPLRNWYHPQV